MPDELNSLYRKVISISREVNKIKFMDITVIPPKISNEFILSELKKIQGISDETRKHREIDSLIKMLENGNPTQQQ